MTERMTPGVLDDRYMGGSRNVAAFNSGVVLVYDWSMLTEHMFGATYVMPVDPDGQEVRPYLLGRQDLLQDVPG